MRPNTKSKKVRKKKQRTRRRPQSQAAERANQRQSTNVKVQVGHYTKPHGIRKKTGHRITREPPIQIEFRQPPLYNSPFTFTDVQNAIDRAINNWTPYNVTQPRRMDNQVPVQSGTKIGTQTQIEKGVSPTRPSTPSRRQRVSAQQLGVIEAHSSPATSARISTAPDATNLRSRSIPK